ncbi:MAG TPA: cyclic nucleotide-binding domain-containing protein [Allosphingosinicella sp.]
MYDSALTSPLSVDRLIAELPFLLLVLAMFWSGTSRIRATVAIAALAGCAHALLLARAPMAAFWWGLLLAVNLMLLARKLHRDRNARFTPDEQTMIAALLPTLAPARTRHLLDQGFWLSGDRGDVLTREDEPVGHLYYLAAGEARVLSQGRQVGTCRAGDLIGEVTVLSGEQASATVILAGPARFWCAPASVLRPYLDAHDEVRHALEHGFATALKSKLRASNRTIAGGGGAPA